MNQSLEELLFVSADLYRDEDDVGGNSSQRCVSQDEAGVDDTHDEDDWDTHQKRGEDGGLEQLVSIARQNIDHLGERWRNSVTSSMLP